MTLEKIWERTNQSLELVNLSVEFEGRSLNRDREKVVDVARWSRTAGASKKGLRYGEERMGQALGAERLVSTVVYSIRKLHKSELLLTCDE